MNGLSLFEIAHEHRQLVNKLADLDLDEQTLADTLDAESWPLQQKCENTLFVVEACKMQQANVERQMARLVELQERLIKREAWLKDRLEMAMLISGTTELTAGTFTLKMQKAKPSVVVLDEKQIPAAYMRQPATPATPPPAPDKKAIADAIKAGTDVPGAKMSDPKLKLVIK